jgi:hypothetical protein
MTSTSAMIERLVAEAAPVRRLRPPLIRALSWLMLAAGVVVALALVHGVRPDIATRLDEVLFCAGIAGSALTGALAAVATFMVCLPDRSRLWLLLPAPSAVLWFLMVSYGCLTNWMRVEADGILAETLRCFGILLATSVPLSAAMLWMLRPAASLRPSAAIVAAGLSVAAVSATTISLLHAFDASLPVLIWNFGAAALVLVACAAAGSWLVGRHARTLTIA